MKVENVICTFCGCLCDDIQVTVEDGEIKKVLRACVTGRNKILGYNKNLARCRVDGKEASLKEAADAAGEILNKSNHPLIYGLSSTSCEAQREAVELAELTGASIDSTASVCHAPGALARQMVGLPTCTLGEVKNRADLIVYWGCNPAEAHLRHASRYAVTPKGMFVPEGRKGRHVVVVDVRVTPTVKMADTHVQIKPGYDYECLATLRALLAGEKIECDEVGGMPLSELEDLVEKMRGCRYGALFFGMGLTMSSGKQNNVMEAIELVRDLNKYTRFCVIPMRGHGNVAGVEQTLSWLTGFPFAINFSKGYPRYGPGEYTAVDLLVREEVDAALIIASDPAAHFPGKAVDYLRRIPTIVIDCHENLTTELARVVIPSAPVGIAAEGTAYRMDNVPLRLKQLVTSPHSPDTRILEMLKERIVC
ncbi:MAG TPA: formylmethanofuran dehydrogenase subunit B [Clostridia bacterium]|nr:formylmethanofuran dehydrogenase subunit B [Clostridia bacterium]